MSEHMKIITKTTHHVDYSELEAAIKRLYGVIYEIAAAEESGNDTSLEFFVDGTIEDYDLADMRKLMAGEFIPFRTELWLNIMCSVQEIPSGDYIVRVSW